MARKEVARPFANSAAKYKKLGWSVFPVREDGSKEPYTKWAHLQKNLATDKDIQTWCKKFPKANVGVACGKKSNIVVLDFDSIDALAKFEARYGEIPETISQTTGRDGGGKHLFFTYPKGVTITNKASGFIEEVDVRGEGGFAVLAPSIHKTGRAYKWDNVDPIEDGIEDLLDIPDMVLRDMIEHVENRHRVGPPEAGHQHNTMKKINDWLLFGAKRGERNDACACLAGHFLYHEGGDYERVYDRIYRWNKEANQEPMSDREVEKTCKSIYRKWKEEDKKKADERIRESWAGIERQEPVRHILHVPLVETKMKKYPDGDRRYVLKFQTLKDNGEPGPVSVVNVSGEEFTNVSRMSNKLLDILGRVLSVEIPSKDWKKLINRMLAYMDVEEMGIQDSDLAQVYDIINDIVKHTDTAPTNIEALGSVPAAVIDGKVVTSAGSIEYAILQTGSPSPSRRELADKLGRLGFKPCGARPRVDGKRLSTKEMPLSKFNKLE